ncbi:hypothetical protein M378DRAFT_162350 [Amanita muscaria Koide BX008]|uniref:Uncharacterized protein n=1 Tax=Amanita muscaria (strain Koide BX008) TaxID=946122 RepID=A0A0C2X736_AMAMK|nr:hypothetical protein M378DRAFT_162350 [Amanita muscaria Koide BX008]
MGAGSEMPLYRELLLVSSICYSRRVVAIQYRTKVKQAQKGVHVDEHGVELRRVLGTRSSCSSTP